MSRSVPSGIPESDLAWQWTGFQRMCSKILFHALSKLKSGSLQVKIVNEPSVRIGQASSSGTHASIAIHDPAFFPRVLFGGEIGLGETFTDGLWSSDDLTSLIGFFIENMDVLDDRKITLTFPARMIHTLHHLLRKNTLEGSKKNIRAHYDLSNQFFQTFLDEKMVYSCARFNSDGDTLEEAQLNKIYDLIQKMDIHENHHILEIGTGWGALALEAAKVKRCKVTTITLSREQYEYTRARVVAAGLDHRVFVLFQDFRTMQGSFDRIISIEMIEAIGHENLGMFFETCCNLLTQGGILVLQTITIPDQRYPAYRKSSDWIRKYIFPGGHLPSLTALSRAATRHSSFVLQHLENIGPHYARTIREWRYRFLHSLDEIRSLGFGDPLIRTWIYYLSYCEAAFQWRYLNDLQLIFTRPGISLEEQTL